MGRYGVAVPTESMSSMASMPMGTDSMADESHMAHMQHAPSTNPCLP
jgi:hypothetical protein